MGKKYIVELGRCERLYKAYINGNGKPNLMWLSPEVDLTPYTEPDLEQVKADAYNDGYKAGREAENVRQPDLERVKKTAHDDGYSDGYDAGLDDAWKAVRKIIHMPEGDLLNLFDVYSSVCTPVQVMLKYDASEAIEKLKAYEQEQEELGIQGYFKNGEEVIDADATKAVILRVSEDNYCQVYTEKGCIENWHIHTYKFHKTGRYFPEIVTVLEKMRGEQDE